jgi:GST-like protein
MFVATGIGPYSGQAVHFKHHTPERIAYAHNRYQFEVERHYTILNERLGKHRYMVGNTYTIVDMCLWGWARMVPYILGEDAWSKLPKAVALKDKFTFKAEMDDEARSHMFRHLKRAS